VLVRRTAAAVTLGDGAPPAGGPPPGDLAALGALLDLLRERDGLDLSGYRRSSLARRVQNRVIAAGEPSLAAYLERLRADPGETARLLDRITIKVSRFFRNRDAVEEVSRALAAEVVRAPRRLRIWSAGCGRGEEPYTLAIVLAELGQPADGPAPIVGTDVDPGALAAARTGTYAPAALEEVPAAIRARWFAAAGPPAAPRWRVADELRRRVTLERHDLVRAERPPRGGPFDLVVCRNTLIYFDVPLQRRALTLLCGALAPGGLLWLGEAEWPPMPLAARLHPIDRRARLFRIAPEGGGHDA
jgi:chemotaxis protein methyltransferase CheR/two-component system CheB/CheR fusion protein